MTTLSLEQWQLRADDLMLMSRKTMFAQCQHHLLLSYKIMILLSLSLLCCWSSTACTPCFSNPLHKIHEQFLSDTPSTNIVYILCHVPPVQHVLFVAVIHLTYVLCCKPTKRPHHIQVDTIWWISCTDAEHRTQSISCAMSILNSTFYTSSNSLCSSVEVLVRNIGTFKPLSCNDNSMQVIGSAIEGGGNQYPLEKVGITIIGAWHWQACPSPPDDVTYASGVNMCSCTMVPAHNLLPSWARFMLSRQTMP